MVTDISLSLAEDMASRAIGFAGSIGVDAMSIVILDRSGTIRLLKRTDTGSLLGPDIAVAKAQSAMSFRISTLALNGTFGENAVTTSAVATATTGRFMPLGGGVPVFHPEFGVIGAVGVAGSTQDNDHQIAEHAVAGSGLKASK